MKQAIMMLWIALCVGPAGTALAQTPPLSPDDLARIARECRSPQPTPFRSTADIQREVDCTSAAIEMLRRGPPAAPSPRLSVTAALGSWVFRYDLDGAAGTNQACVVSGPLTLPAGRPVEITLTSDDTIHELQLPTLGIKTSAIPGRINIATLRADAVGTVTGVAVTAEGTARQQTATVSVRFLVAVDYALWERETLRARGCGVVR
jgi:heme/copper-type cytochrome/quinol oxidase subunit 2